jgi:hypothetical protein
LFIALITELLFAKSGNKWTADDVGLLGICFENVNFDDFLNKLYGNTPLSQRVVSEKASTLIDELQTLPTLSALDKCYSTAAENRKVDATYQDAFLELPLVKATYFVKKYQDQESIVDSFMHLLLGMLGFFDGWTYAFPQMKVSLTYGDATKEATADFTILDVLSFYRMAIIEDKRFQDHVVNSEPQLIAESIALHQANSGISKKRRRSSRGSSSAEVSSSSSHVEGCGADGNIFGVRVNGLDFYFYLIPVSKTVLSAMSNNSATTTSTIVFKLAQTNSSTCSFDWMEESDRNIIIRMLDAFSTYIRHHGAISQRRPSGAAASGSG